MAELVEDAVGRGAKALVGGHERDGAGYFYDPTVLTDVPKDAHLLKEEIFGPVAPVRGFDDEDEAIAAANDTEYGLVAYVYTSNIKRALRVVEKLETGMVGLNQGMVSNPAAPFGGIKQSGFGREGGPEGIEEYSSEVRGGESVAAERRPRRTADRRPRSLKLRRTPVDTGITQSLPGCDRTREVTAQEAGLP